MKLPDIDIRQACYKGALLLAAIFSALGTAGLIPLTQALAAGVVFGAIGNFLADKAVTQQKKDGTLVLTGSVQEQVSKGLDILINQAIQTINNAKSIGGKITTLDEAQVAATKAIQEVPVVGSLVQDALKQILK